MKRLVLVALLVACSSKKTVHVDGAFANVVPSGAGAVYLSIVNDTGDEDRLEHVTSPAAEAQLHESVTTGETSSMRELPEGIVVPAHAKLSLARNGKHVMLFGIRGEPTTVPLVLHFAHAGSIPVDAPVRPLFEAP